MNLQVPVRLSFWGLPWQKMLAKCTEFVTGCCFVHPPLIFATWNLINPCRAYLSFALVYIAKVCEHSALLNVMKNPLSIMS